MIEGAHVPQAQLSLTSDKGISLIQVQALLRKREREIPCMICCINALLYY